MSKISVMRVCLNERFWIPESTGIRKRAIRLYQTKVYDERNCAKCEFRPDRHCEVCDDCPAYITEVKLWKEREVNGTTWIGVPKGNRAKIKKLVGDAKVSIVDKRGSVKMRHPLKFVGELRSHQKKPIAKIIEVGYGVLKAPPRAGKTVMAVSIACKLKLKTLIVAAQQEWLDEFYRTFCGNETEAPMSNAPDIEKFEGRKIVGMCKTLADFDKYDVCLATYQTFISVGGKAKLKQVRSKFGLVIVDECFTGEHRLMTKQGLVSIRDLFTEATTDTQVLSRNMLTGQPEFKSIESRTIKKTAKLCRVSVGEAVYHCTPNHLWWVINRNTWVEAQYLKPGDALA